MSVEKLALYDVKNHMPDPFEEKKSMTEDSYNDLYPVQLKDPEVPIQEDCASEFVPPGTIDVEGKKKVLVPELITMTKVLFDRYAWTASDVNKLRIAAKISAAHGDEDRFWPVSAYKKSFLYAGRKFYLHKKFKNYMQKQVDFLHKKS